MLFLSNFLFYSQCSITLQALNDHPWGANYGIDWGGKTFKVNEKDAKLNDTEDISFASQIKNLNLSI